MSFGKAVGWAATSAVSGVMLVSFGLKTTAFAAAVVSSVFFFAFIFVLERPGERRLPWSSGESASAHREGNSFKAVFSGVNKVLWQRASLMVMAIMLFDGLISGYGHALMPIAAVKVFGFTSTAVVATGCHDGSHRCRPHAGFRADDRSLWFKTHVDFHHLAGGLACIPAGPDTVHVDRLPPM